MDDSEIKSIEENERFWQKLVEEDLQTESLTHADATTSALDAEALCAEDSRADSTESAPDTEQTFEETLADLSQAIMSMPRLREMYLKILDFCLIQRDLEEAEREIEGYPEFSYGAQPPYRLIKTLVKHGGLDWLEISFDGHVITPEEKIGLTEDEIDDLIEKFAIKTTPVGEQAMEDLSPTKRLSELLDNQPKRSDAYRDIMEFCRESRSYQDIHNLLSGKDVLKLTNNSDGNPLQPSFFIDMLERSGGLVWNQGWKITKSGEALLAQLAKVSA